MILLKQKKKKVIKPHFASVQYELKPIPDNAIWPGVLEQGSRWCYANEMDYKNKLLIDHRYIAYKKLEKKIKIYIQ